MIVILTGMSVPAFACDARQCLYDIIVVQGLYDSYPFAAASYCAEGFITVYWNIMNTISLNCCYLLR